MIPVQHIAAIQFTLRKYAWLLLLAEVAVLAVGWQYARGQEPLVEASATIQIRQRPGMWIKDAEVWIDKDISFIADQTYRIPRDTQLAERVHERLLAPIAEGTPPPGQPDVPLDVYERAIEGLRPANVGGQMRIAAVPGTSFYRISVAGAEATRVVALANAWATEVVEMFQAESRRAVEDQIEDWRRDLQARRDIAQKRLTELRERLSELKTAHPEIEYSTLENPLAAPLRRLEERLFDRQVELERSARERSRVDVLLQASGLALREVEMGDAKLFHVEPALVEPAADDPRLSAPIQSLPMVAGHAGVRRVQDAIRRLERADQDMAVGPPILLEEAVERRAIRRHIESLQAELARETEAALCVVATTHTDLAEYVAGLAERVEALTERSRAMALELARAGELTGRADDLEAEVRSYDARLMESAQVIRLVLENSASEAQTSRVIAEARADATAKVVPNQGRIIAWSALCAQVLALLLVFLLTAADDTVKSREDLDRKVPRTSVVGMIPDLGSNARAASALLDPTVKGRTRLVESLRALRTTVLVGTGDARAKTVLITSASPGEGKTSLSVGLAASFAGAGERTLLIDADMRRPAVHSAASAAVSPGLAEVLQGEAAWDAAVQQCTAIRRLEILAAGAGTEDPAALLGGQAMQELLARAASEYDRVILDSPPVLNVTDACLLAQWADATLLVVRVSKTSARAVRRAIEVLTSVGAAPRGVVLNRVASIPRIFGESYERYGDGYSSRSSDGKGTPQERKGRGGRRAPA